jgi:hypothetical protein
MASLATRGAAGAPTGTPRSRRDVGASAAAFAPGLGFAPGAAPSPAPEARVGPWGVRLTPGRGIPLAGGGDAARTTAASWVGASGGVLGLVHAGGGGVAEALAGCARGGSGGGSRAARPWGIGMLNAGLTPLEAPAALSRSNPCDL